MKQFIAFNRQHWFTALTFLLFVSVMAGVSDAAARIDSSMFDHVAGSNIFEVTTAK